ncbi:hypothetical protein JCM10213_009217 [Rhodosporidiobolus nylandii]
MGVHGLTSFVRKNTSLGTYISLPPPDPRPPTATSTDDSLLSSTANGARNRIPFIVDGLAFLYHVGLVDPFRGGNYTAVRATVRRYVTYWRACGLEPEFVWDGPFDSNKLPTVIQRSAQSLARSIAYMRSSDTARADAKLRNSAARLPALTHMAVSAELEALHVPCHCAEEEADSPTAELAQRKNGFVASNDSDYFIYPARCRGYVPLTSMEYGAYNQPRVEQVHPAEPPKMRLRVYQHETIAQFFSLPPSFLPILAALIGNDASDYSSDIILPRPRGARPRFPGQMEPQELRRIAAAVSLFANYPVSSLAEIQDVVFAVLPRLLVGRVPSDPNIITNVSLSAFGYALRPLEIPSPSYPLHPSPADSPFTATSRALYEAAYKSSHLSSFFLHVLKHGTVVIQGGVEMPEYQTPTAVLGRPLRLWVYAVLQDAFGGRLPHGAEVVEYVRRQDELHPAHVAVPLLANLVAAAGGDRHLYLPPAPSPLLLTPQPSRFALYLLALAYPSMPPLSTSHLSPFFPLVLALRHIQHFNKRPWSVQEQLSALLVAVLLRLAPTSLPVLAAQNPLVPPRPFIQRSVELVQTLVFVNLLGQALLLCRGQLDAQGVEGTLPPPFEVFDGAGLHGLLRLRESEMDKVLNGCPAEVQSTVRELSALLAM